MEYLIEIALRNAERLKKAAQRLGANSDPSKIIQWAHETAKVVTELERLAGISQHQSMRGGRKADLLSASKWLKTRALKLSRFFTYTDAKMSNSKFAGATKMLERAASSGFSERNHLRRHRTRFEQMVAVSATPIPSQGGGKHKNGRFGGDRHRS